MVLQVRVLDVDQLSVEVARWINRLYHRAHDDRESRNSFPKDACVEFSLHFEESVEKPTTLMKAWN